MLRIWASIEPKVILSVPSGPITIIATCSDRIPAASTMRSQKVSLSTRSATVLSIVLLPCRNRTSVALDPIGATHLRHPSLTTVGRFRATFCSGRKGDSECPGQAECCDSTHRERLYMLGIPTHRDTCPFPNCQHHQTVSR